MYMTTCHSSICQPNDGVIVFLFISIPGVLSSRGVLRCECKRSAMVQVVSNAFECSPMLRMLSNVRNAIECSLLLSLVCRKSRNSKVVALAAVLLTSERSQLSCTQAVTRNVWGRVLQRLKSIATCNIWKRVFEFNNQFSVQGRSNIEQHFLFHLPSFFLSFFILRLCILPCRTSSCTIGKWIDNPSCTWQLVIRRFCQSNDGGIGVCCEFRCSLVKRGVLLCECKRSAMEVTRWFIKRSFIECSRLLSNVWGRIAQRLRSYAKFDIWSGVFEFSSPLISYLHKRQVAYRSSCSFWFEFGRCFH